MEAIEGQCRVISRDAKLMLFVTRKSVWLVISFREYLFGKEGRPGNDRLSGCVGFSFLDVSNWS